VSVKDGLVSGCMGLKKIKREEDEVAEKTRFDEEEESKRKKKVHRIEQNRGKTKEKK